MTEDNFTRMIKLAEEFFDMKNDPQQISVDEEVIARLQKIHPCTMSEKRDVNGPIAWLLVIPTTNELMKEFVGGRISEKELLDTTPLGVNYEAIYLCSALVLPEFRGKGLAKELIVQAVQSIRNDHPVENLFFWGFSREGRRLAESVARDLRMPLLERT